MICDTGITLYHSMINPDSRSEVYTRYYFPKCSVKGKVSVEKRHSRNGPWRERETVIRIPVEKAINLSIGDRVVLGRCELDNPPAESLQVSGFADNRRGRKNVKHYKIVCR